MQDEDTKTGGTLPLGPRELFFLVAEECFRDGQIEPGENHLLNRLAVALGLGKEEITEIGAKVSRRVQKQGLVPGGRFRPQELLARVRDAIAADGHVDPGELELLEILEAELERAQTRPQARSDSEPVPEPTPASSEPSSPDASLGSARASDSTEIPASDPDPSPRAPEGKPKTKQSSEEGSDEARASTAQRFRITRKEFLLEAAETLDSDLAPSAWRRLSKVCAQKPRFEGMDAFTLLGGALVFFGGGWTLDKIYDLVGITLPAILAGFGSWKCLQLSISQGPSKRSRANGLAVLSVLLSVMCVAGVLDGTGLDDWMRPKPFGRNLLTTLYALGPIVLPIRLLRAGVGGPNVLGFVLAASSLVLSVWIDFFFDPGKHLTWFLGTLWGLALLRLGFAIDRRTEEDLASAPYRFGLALTWFLGLWGMPYSGEVAWLAFALGNFFLMTLSALLQRGAFLTCGAIGIYAWMGHLARRVFPGSLAFPFVLTAVGLAIMGSGLWVQRNQDRFQWLLLSWIPESLRPELPSQRPAPPRSEATEASDPKAHDTWSFGSRASRLDLSEDEWIRALEALPIGEETRRSLWQRLSQGEPTKARLSLAHILYFFGALTVIASMTFFMGLCWQTLGVTSVFLLTSLYIALFSALGLKFWSSEETQLPGGLLVTIAVCLVPLATWALQGTLGFWPHGNPGNYSGFFHWIKGGWFGMEVATLLAGALALRRVRFPFLTAPIAFTLWFLSMDLVPLLWGSTVGFRERAWISMGFGLLTLALGWFLDRRTRKDFSYWIYLFGVLTFWGGLTNSGSGTVLGKWIYAGINAGMVLVGAHLGRGVFQLFGMLGFVAVVSEQVYRTFAHVPGFPFFLGLFGIFLIWLGRVLDQRLEAWEQSKAQAAPRQASL